MKTIIKLLFAVVLLTACFNVIRALVNEYQFEDDVQQGLLFNPRLDDKGIVDLVMKSAEEHEIPIEPDGVSINRTNQNVRVDMSYTAGVVVIPGVFTQPWTFSPSAATRILTGGSQ